MMVDKFKRILKRICRSWITVWLVVITVIFVALVGQAFYTGVSSVKRVVSTKAGVGILFSSDYMSTGTLVTTEYGDYSNYTGTDQPTYTFVVSNHAQGDRHSWFTEKDIEYTVTAELVKNQKYGADDLEAQADASLIGQYKPVVAADIAGKTFKIGKKNTTLTSFVAGSAITFTFTGENALSKTIADDELFEIIIDKSELLMMEPTILVKLTATPTNISGGEVKTLYGYIGICSRPAGGATWSGSINDENYESNSLEYDAYNYVFSGNGSGTFYVAWDSSKLSPNAFFLENFGSSITQQVTTLTDTEWAKLTQYNSNRKPSNSGEWKYFAISVDSDDLARYELQFYKTDRTEGLNYGSSVKNYVDYGFEVSTQGSGNGE